MTIHPRLARVGDRYHLRARVPDSLHDVLGKKEVWRKLGTSDKREALQRVRVESVKVDAEFAAARRRARREEAAPGETEAMRMVALWFHREDQRAAEPEFTALGVRALEDALDDLSVDEAALHRGDEAMAAVQQVVDRILADNGWPSRRHRVGGVEARSSLVVDVDKSGAWYAALCARVLRAMVELTRRSRGRLHGQPLGLAFDPAFTGVGAGGKEPEPLPHLGVTVEELVELYQAAPERRHLSGKTMTGYAVIFRALRELLGPDRRVREITRDDCRRVRDVVVALPPNATKRFPGATLADAARLAKDGGVPTLTPASANSYINNLASLLNWAVAEEYLERNPATRLAVSVPTTSRRERRRPFSTEQLRRIFGAPLYAGCMDDGDGYATPGESRPRRGRFWVPLVALYTGMRLNEICQLAADDVQSLDGVDVVLVRPDGDGKRVKSRAGVRVVPVHPELVGLGFLRHVEGVRRAGGGRLFPDLRAGANGYYSDPFAKWFSRFLAKAGAAAPRTSFHSFRHGMTDALRNGGVAPDRIRALLGWAGSGMEETTYGQGHAARVLAAEVEKVAYPGLDLGHLLDTGDARTPRRRRRT